MILLGPVFASLSSGPSLLLEFVLVLLLVLAPLLKLCRLYFFKINGHKDYRWLVSPIA